MYALLCWLIGRRIEQVRKEKNKKPVKKRNNRKQEKIPKHRPPENLDY